MMRQPVMTAREVGNFLDEVLPAYAGLYRVESVAPMAAVMTQRIDETHLRFGGTVSGPTMFALVDCAFYVVLLAHIGRQALTVTTNLNINFLRKPPAADLRAEARILRLGRTLATGDVTVFSTGADGPVAHATVTYAVPGARQ